MASTYTTNTGIEKPATGEQSGTWGTTTNTNFDIIDRALNGVGTITLSGTTHTLSTTDGTLSDGMYKVLLFGGSPSGTNTVTVSPNTQQKIFYAKNGSGQSVIISQGSGSTVTINDGETRIVYCDGAGAGAAVVDLTATFPVDSGVPSGTKQLFVQTSAPTGWTKDTTNNNDSAIRIVTGSVSTGGTTGFTSALGTPSVTGTVSISGAPDAGNLAVSISGNISDTTLSNNQIPSHRHSILLDTNGGGFQLGALGDNTRSNPPYASTYYTNYTGGGGSHNHSHNLSGTMTGDPGVGNLSSSLASSTAAINVKYVDVIVATKD